MAGPICRKGGQLLPAGSGAILQGKGRGEPPSERRARPASFHRNNATCQNSGILREGWIIPSAPAARAASEARQLRAGSPAARAARQLVVASSPSSPSAPLVAGSRKSSSRASSRRSGTCTRGGSSGRRKLSMAMRAASRAGEAWSALCPSWLNRPSGWRAGCSASLARATNKTRHRRPLNSFNAASGAGAAPGTARRTGLSGPHAPSTWRGAPRGRRWSQGSNPAAPACARR